MKPTQNMYATREEWENALADWLEAVPTLDNQKQFMIFEGDKTPEDLMFTGDLLDFADCYFVATDWDQVINFVNEFNYLFLLEGTDEFDDMNSTLDAYEDERDAAREEFEASKWEEPGLYDAGGHMRPEVAAEYADILKDRQKDGD